MAYVTVNITPLNVGLMVWTASRLMQIIRCAMLIGRFGLATDCAMAWKNTTTLIVDLMATIVFVL